MYDFNADRNARMHFEIVTVGASSTVIMDVIYNY